MPAQFGEEIVVDANLFEAEDLGPQGRENLLERGAWRHVGPSQLGTVLIGGRQRGAFEFAVGRQGQGIEHQQGRGHHVFGQLPGQELAQVRHQPMAEHRLERVVRVTRPRFERHLLVREQGRTYPARFPRRWTAQ